MAKKTTTARAKNLTAALKQHGVDVAKTDVLRMSPLDVTLYWKDDTHPLFRKGVDVVDPNSSFYDPSVELVEISDASVEDVRTRGYDKAIQVTRNGEMRNGRPMIVCTDGRQRVKIGRILHKRHGEAPRLKCDQVVGSIGDITIRALASNAPSINQSPVSTAWKMRTALKNGKTKEEICAALTIGAPAFDELIALLDMEPEVQRAFDPSVNAGVVLPRTTIRDVARLPREKQADAVKQVAAHVEKRTAAKKEKAAKKSASSSPAAPKAKRHEVRAVVEAIATDRPLEALPVRLQVLPRARIEELAAAVSDERVEGALTSAQRNELRVLRGAFRLVLGYDDALAEFPSLRAILGLGIPPVNTTTPAAIDAHAN